MENFGLRRRRFLPAAAALWLAGCQGIATPALTDAQKSELDAHVGVYHICVARMAARLDDGRSPVTRIADLAVDYCKPKAREVELYLDAIRLPPAFTLRYLGQLSDMAARQSAIMLRQRRQPDWRPIRT